MDGNRNYREELYVSGKELLETIKRLVSAGNARAIVVWSEAGKKLLEIPLTAGVAIGGAAVLLAPFVAAIAAIAAMAGKVRLEVIPREPADKDDDFPHNAEP